MKKSREGDSARPVDPIGNGFDDCLTQILFAEQANNLANNCKQLLLDRIGRPD